MNRSRLTLIGCAVGLFFAASVVAAAVSGDREVARLGEFETLVKESLPDDPVVPPELSPSDDSSRSGVIGANGKFIKCNGAALLIENRGAAAPVAFVEGRPGATTAMPEASDPTRALGTVGYAPRCGPDDGAPVWITVEP